MQILQDRNYQRFAAGYAVSFTLYWVTLLALGWWVWDATKSPFWVGLVYFCDLIPALFITPWAAAMADRGDRFVILRWVLWVQVVTSIGLGLVAWVGYITPTGIVIFATVEGALVGFSQPAFFGMINRIVPKDNLAPAVAFNSTITQTSFIVGPILAAFVFSFGMNAAPLAFAANGIGTLIYLMALASLTLSPAPQSNPSPHSKWHDSLQGLRLFWTTPAVFAATSMVIAIAVLQRPLINLMPTLNAELTLLQAHQFGWLTSAFMLGTVMASLTFSTGWITATQDLLWRAALAAPVIFIAGIVALATLPSFLAFLTLTCMGYITGLTVTGAIILLQTETPEHHRSRVLGNNFMINRAFGAIAVVSAGWMVGATSVFAATFIWATIAALIVAFAMIRTQKQT